MAIISLALVPLGIIALLASLQANRTADLQHQADLRVAVSESTRKLGTELASDIAALTVAADALGRNEPPIDVCARTAAILAARSTHPIRFALFGPTRDLLCATRNYRPDRPVEALFESGPSAILLDDALNVRVPSRSGNSAAVALYSDEVLREFTAPTGYAEDYALVLTAASRELPLVSQTSRSKLLGSLTYAAPVGVLGVGIRVTVDTVPFGATEALVTFLPLLMWASAAAIGFFVVDRLLIRPLAELQSAVAAHIPGQRFVFPPIATPALEIRTLGETFSTFAAKISEHDAELAQALSHQTKLTREVHHRVKNNLQVVSSLISLHARSAALPGAVTAYASIQRRVDALATVHRNHFAELEENSGVNVKALLGELGANLRATAPADAPAPPISISGTAFQISQDTAIPIAFLITELTELSMVIDQGAAISVALENSSVSGRAHFRITSLAFTSEPRLAERLTTGYGRIIEGLARQLRSPLHLDSRTGTYAIDIPILTR